MRLAPGRRTGAVPDEQGHEIYIDAALKSHILKYFTEAGIAPPAAQLRLAHEKSIITLPRHVDTRRKI